MDGLRREFGLGLRYIVVLVLPASVLFAVLAQPMLAVIVRHQFTAHDAVVTADTLQAFAHQPRAVLDLPLRDARVLRAAGHPHTVHPQRVRERLERGARDRPLPPLRCAGSRAGVERRVLRRRGGGAHRVTAPDRRRPRRDRDQIDDPSRGCRARPWPSWPRRSRARSATRRRPTALLATAVGRRRRAVLVYVLALLALRSDELSALVGLLRRRGATSSRRVTMGPAAGSNPEREFCPRPSPDPEEGACQFAS